MSTDPLTPRKQSRGGRGGYRVYICPVPEPAESWTKALPDGTPCPKEAKHTASPRGYLNWHDWATKKARTHRSVRCDGCDRFTIWEPRVPA